MPFIFISIIVPGIVYVFLPLVIRAMGKKPVASNLLLVAGIIYFISWYLPSPLIEGENTALTTHFVGGGIFSGFVWLYLIKQFDRKFNVFFELATLYFLVSGLGVANELFELLISKIRIVELNPADTWWDLLANTLGALSFWAGYKLFSHK